jgi:hypothetical protein
MSKTLWADVLERLNKHSHMGLVDRSSQRVALTAEHFTPSELVVEVLQGVPLEDLAAGQTVLDPACGDGQFLVAVKWVKVLAHGMTPSQAVRDLYGIDLMRDNVDLCLERLGGGTILVGDALSPRRRVEGQSEAEYQQLCALLEPSDLALF